MQGKYEVVVKNARLQYKFTIERNITILRGDSATGKTTLIDMILAYQLNGNDSGVNITCDKTCVVLTAMNWELNLQQIKDSIVFIDEGGAFVKSKEFAAAIERTDNYYVIATRASLFSLPYSIHEVYGIKNTSGNRYQGTKRLYSEFYPLNHVEIEQISKPDCMIVEDTNAGYEFWADVCNKHNIPCISAKGKSNIYTKLKESEKDTILVIVDGAAFGPELERILMLRRARNIIIYLPESFEWLILKSGLVAETVKILESPYDYIDSEKYISWERFFTDVLVGKTKDTYLQYSKKSLNPVYLHQKEQSKILEVVPEIEW